MINKRLSIFLVCLLVVMIGVGITHPVLPFDVERLALGEGASDGSIHVGLLTGVYAPRQLLFARVWGRLSDGTGRRPLIFNRHFRLRHCASSFRSGYIAMAALRGADSRWHFVLGNPAGRGSLHCRHDEQRGRGMAWLGTAVSLGFVVGPALRGTLYCRDLHGALWGT